jgi:hypothetical protein
VYEGKDITPGLGMSTWATGKIIGTLCEDYLRTGNEKSLARAGKMSRALMKLATFDTDHNNLTNVAGQNGLLQNQVDAAKTDLEGRQTMGEGLLGNLTAVDMAKAVSDLQQAQLSVQAAAQVFSSLKSTRSNVLPPSADLKMPRSAFGPYGWPSTATKMRSGFRGSTMTLGICWPSRRPRCVQVLPPSADR